MGHSGNILRVFAVLLSALHVCMLGADSSTSDRSTGGQQGRPLLKGQAAQGNWTTDAPRVRRLITVEDLPPPFESKSVDNPPRVVPRPKDMLPKAPSGFKVELLASGLTNPREVTTAPSGDLFVAESDAGRVRVLRLDADGKVERSEIFATGLRQPFGIAFYPPGDEPRFVYVANTDSVVRFPYRSGDLKARGKPETIVTEIPGGGRLRGGGHWTRDLEFTPDGRRMFVSVGSLSNVNDDEAEKHRASILAFNPQGGDFKLYAWGIRNPVGIAIEPQTRKLWASVNERDGLGDDLVPDYITHVQEDGFYGWPWYYIGNHQDPRHKGKRPDLAEKVIVPDVLLQSHTASLCMEFYTGKSFPAEYHGDAFAAQHGSWNRARRTGYKVIRVPLDKGKATGEYEDFLTGFVTPQGEVWGRPVGVAVDNAGALIVTDDASNSIWRVSYSR